MAHESDRCSVCGASLTEETVTYTQTLGENLFVVEDVPAQVCPQCGETYLSPHTANTLLEIGQQSVAQPDRTINVPVYHFTAALTAR